jgi:hypothetical protein
MDKRYQVFLSSTFSDLQEERSIAIQTLMEIDCIPAGMELFPALDEEQFEFIKRVIDDSDYYLLIIGGRYGSLSETGISYTEMEYDYAIERGIKVIALIHGSPEKLIAEKVEMSPDARQKLDGFRARAQTGRLVKFWNDAKELSGLVATSLPKTIKMYPAVGWIRGNEATDNTELLKQLNDLRQENNKLEKQIQELQSNKNNMSDLAQGEDEVVISVKCNVIKEKQLEEVSWEQEVTWNNLFKSIGLKILNGENENFIFDILGEYIASRRYENFHYPQIDLANFEQIKVQFLSLGYISFDSIGTTNYWEITPEGEKYLLEIMPIKRKINEIDDE